MVNKLAVAIQTKLGPSRAGVSGCEVRALSDRATPSTSSLFSCEGLANLPDAISSCAQNRGSFLPSAWYQVLESQKSSATILVQCPYNLKFLSFFARLRIGCWCLCPMSCGYSVLCATLWGYMVGTWQPNYRTGLCVCVCVCVHMYVSFFLFVCRYNLLAIFLHFYFPVCRSVSLSAYMSSSIFCLCLHGLLKSWVIWSSNKVWPKSFLATFSWSVHLHVVRRGCILFRWS